LKIFENSIHKRYDKFYMADDTSIFWIIVPLIIAAILVATCCVVPILARRYCKGCFPDDACGPCCDYVGFCMECLKRSDDGYGCCGVETREDYVP